ncbi:hypothetical protein JCM8202v2_004811 [Rhodotorula sphaerocarpa]
MADLQPHLEKEIDKLEIDHVEKADVFPTVEGIQPPARIFTPEEEDKLYRKVDLRIMPILSLLYLLSFMDRGNIGNARIEGLEKELNMNSQEFNTTLSCFFITYCLCEPLANIVMLKFFKKPSNWLGLVTTVWAIVMTLMGVVKSYGGLLAARLALGIADLLAYGISFMSGVGGYAGWRWIFILEGLATLVAGVAAFWAISDYPQDCKWLTKEEADWLIYRKKIDSGPHGESSHMSWKFVRQALVDWQTYLGVLYYLGVVVPLYAISLISPTLINSFGKFTRPQVQLMTVPYYAVACVFVVVTSILADRQKTRYRWMMIDLLLCTVGLIINLTPAPYGVKYMGIFLIAMGSYGGLPTCVTWCSNNLSGQGKRAFGSAFQIGIGNLGALASSNVYRKQDSPHYYLGHGVILAFNIVGIIAAPVYAHLLKRANQRKLVEQQEGPELTVEEIHDLGDKAPHFMYTI